MCHILTLCIQIAFKMGHFCAQALRKVLLDNRIFTLKMVIISNNYTVRLTAGRQTTYFHQRFSQTLHALINLLTFPNCKLFLYTL